MEGSETDMNLNSTRWFQHEDEVNHTDAYN